MVKTIDGKYIFTHKGEDYVPLEDYVNLLQEKEDLKEKNEWQRIQLADRDKEIARLRRVILAAISNDNCNYYN